MTTQTNYTPDEWKVLKDAPLLVAEAVAAASSSGLIGTLKEGAVIVTGMMNTAKQHPGNQLVQNVTPKSVDTNQAISWAQTALSTLRGTGNTEHIKRQALEISNEVSQVLARKSPQQEADDYKHWLLEIGEGVARAAKEGTGVTSVSPEENRMLNEISHALHVPR